MRIGLWSPALLLTLGGMSLACGGRGIPQELRVPPAPKDAGTNTAIDSGVVRDAGPTIRRDAGTVRPRDAAVDLCGDGFCDSSSGETFVTCPADCRPPGACPDGSEGCACNSTWVAGDSLLNQDDCESALLVCVPWDELSGRQFELTGPIQSCVRPCRTNADCEGGMTCAASLPYQQQAGLESFCVDRIAPADTVCGASRLTTSRIPGVQVLTGREMVGCGRDTTCVMGLLESVHPDEGVCLQGCGLSGDAPCRGDTPFCNPNILGDGRGICSIAQLGGGSWCNITENERFGLTSVCDQSGDSPGPPICVGLGLDRGLCFELCDQNQPCIGGDANGTYYCAEELLTNGGGLCMSQNCSQFPDTCVGAGLEGVGQTCIPLTETDGLCVDRISPVLAAATLDSMGMVLSTGDDCAQSNIDFVRCPEQTSCLAVGTGRSVCMPGCNPMAPNMCGSILMSLGSPSGNATCVDLFQDGMSGLCGGD